ncbi:tetraacyldisaccharide 4'-kinase [bacterium]|nr:MAG: tetraacyldisaccharide 4'-kinase [bacterium]
MQKMSILSQISDISPGFLLWLRWNAYRKGILHSAKLPHPVISVGSIIMGGSGKTPFTEFLAKMLISAGRKPGILSRGYARSSKELLVVKNGDKDWHLCGDEPLLLSKRLPDVPIAVHPDRYKAGMHIANDVDTFILDDGFQHLKLHRNLDIVMLEGSEYKMGLFPFGLRRDGLWRLRNLDDRSRAIAIFPENKDFKNIINILPKNVKKFHRHTVIEGIHPVGNFKNIFSASTLIGKKIFVACGIARPERLVETVKSLGGNIVGQLFFRDHAFFRINQVGAVINEAENTGADVIITSQKDAVRISELNPPDMFALAIRTEIAEKEEFFKTVQDILSAL